MDHKALWERLREELYFLCNNEVRVIDPRIILCYMGFLEEIKEAQDVSSDKG